MSTTSRCSFIGPAAVVALVLVGTAVANVRLEFPGVSPGPPAYAEISNVSPFGEAIIHTDEWAAIPFYRQPACVPSDFNLLQFAHVPDAFACEATVQGFEIWTAPPPEGQGPIQVRAWGTGSVPVYFVKWTELQAAIADGVLRIGELQSLPSLKIGYASFFTAEAHPAMTASSRQIIGAYQLSARGVLQDGRLFQIQVATGGPAGPAKHVKITIM